VAVILEAFDASTWPSQPEQWAHNARRSVEVGSGRAKVRVIAVFAANALNHCPNLGENDLCGIYHERPLVCRIYPMEINPFITLRPEHKGCPPEAWQQGEVLFTDRIVDPALQRQVNQSRQADRDDARAKVAVCEALGLTVAAWKEDALAVYLPDRVQLADAIARQDAGLAAAPAACWRVRVDTPGLSERLAVAGVALAPAAAAAGYTFYPLK